MTALIFVDRGIAQIENNDIYHINTRQMTSTILERISPEWSPFIDTRLLENVLTAIDEMGDSKQLAPVPGLIFEALRYCTPDDVKVVIIGQDPYPTPGEAQGLCFSQSKGGKIPKSLERIFGCLERAGLRSKRTTAPSGDLRSWAVQGVLMLNTALTTRIGARRAHAKLWKPFFTVFLTRLCEARTNKPLHFMLWGNDARKLAPIARGHMVHEWTHPSPMVDNRLPAERRFIACTHFEDVNAALAAGGCRPISWDNAANCTSFSDGSCSKNGLRGARASYAAVVLSAHHGRVVMRGEVYPTEYEFVDSSAVERGIRPVNNGKFVAPSNNRGELLGFIYAMLAPLVCRFNGNVEIVSDSKITVQTMLEWLPNRIAKNTEAEMKNFDLVMIAWNILTQLRSQADVVEITHVNSHKPKPLPTALDRTQLLWAGNDSADKHASIALPDNHENYDLIIINGPPALNSLIILDDE